MAHALSPHWLEHVKIPPGVPGPRTLDEWRKAREEIRKVATLLLGDFPPRTPPVCVRVRDRTEFAEYVVERFEFDNGLGDQVPGLLILPKGARGRRPGLLYCHWHGDEYHVGKEELLRRDHTPEEPALAFAREGYVVIGIDACGFGERSGKSGSGFGERGRAEELTNSKFALWVGWTLWGLILRDDRIALDYLLGRPEVDPQRIGVTGISMGATRSWWLAALDERIRGGVAVGCMTRYQDLIEAGGLGEHGIYYYVPRLLSHFDSEALISLIAPRPMLFLTGACDPGSPLPGIGKIASAVSSVYGLYEAGFEFESRVFEGVGHVYTPRMWAEMKRWFRERVFNP